MSRCPTVSLVRRILFSGYYGHCNTGDDAFCAIAAWGAHHYWKTKDIRFLCRRLPRVPVPARAVLSEQQSFRGQNMLEMLYQMAISPTLIFAGGSIFHGSEGRERDRIRKFQRIIGIKLGAIGVSLGPYKSEESYRDVKHFLQRFSFLVLRDHQSFLDACSMDLPYTPVEGFDLAAFLPEIYGPLSKPGANDKTEPVVGVILRHYERYTDKCLDNERRREQLVLETLRKVTRNTQVRLRFFVFNAHPKYNDDEVTKKMSEALTKQAKVEIVPYCNDPGRTWKRISECNAVLSIRLHGAIFAFVAAVPFLLVEYHRKCGGFLNAVGWPPKWRIGDMQVSADHAASILMEILENPIQAFPVDLKVISAKAEQNFIAVIDR